MTGSEVGDREDLGAGTQIRDTWSTMTLYVGIEGSQMLFYV